MTFSPKINSFQLTSIILLSEQLNYWRLHWHIHIMFESQMKKEISVNEREAGECKYVGSTIQTMRGEEKKGVERVEMSIYRYSDGAAR